MRFAPKSVLLAALLSGTNLAGASAAPRSAIDLDPASPTLGEMLDREAAARRQAREAEARARAEAERAARMPETTGSILPRRVVQEPSLPRGAVTVILPHPKASAGRPISSKPDKR